jgi:ketosteroid isomerase-like protein
MAQGSIIDKDIADLVRRTADANAALMCGDIGGYLRLIKHAADFTLMTPFGGAPTRGFDMSSERLAALGRFFKAGKTDLELVQTYASGDLAVLVIIERQRAEVGGLPEQDWSLRVTLVYRRDGAEWRLAHRHADPLVKTISVEQAAVIARG